MRTDEKAVHPRPGGLMTLVRIYIPLNAAGLRSLDVDRALAGAPFLAHAVTEAVRASAPNAHQDELEYAALNNAALSSAALLGSGESRRIVAAADVPPGLVGSPAPSDLRIESLVSISDSVPFQRIASFHVDDGEASEDDELLWYDVTELSVILAML
jgi:hypothetical protein